MFEDAGLGPPLRQITPDAFATAGRPLARRLAGFRIGLAVTVLAAVAGAVFAGLDEGVGVAVAGGVLVLVAVVGAFASGDMLFGRLETWLFVDLLMVTVWLLVWVWPNPLAVVGSLLLLGVVALVRGPLSSGGRWAVRCGS